MLSFLFEVREEGRKLFYELYSISMLTSWEVLAASPHVSIQRSMCTSVGGCACLVAVGASMERWACLMAVGASLGGWACLMTVSISVEGWACPMAMGASVGEWAGLMAVSPSVGGWVCLVFPLSSSSLHTPNTSHSSRPSVILLEMVLVSKWLQ